MSAKILIVDDQKPVTSMVSLVLGTDAYRIKTAHSGTDALELAKTWRPDLVLLDVMMPEMDGFEVCRRLRLREETFSVPVIMLTARDEVQDKIVGFEVGADDYITKPFNHDELKARVAARLRRVQATSQRIPYEVGKVVSVPLVLHKQRSGLFRRGYRVTKRIFDLLVCVVAAPFVILLLAAIAAAVRLDSPGPIVFVQKRAGLHGKPFKMLKFRTMVRNAEELKAKYAHLNELTWPDFKITDDPRVTRVGKFLRRTSLDELPQLWNVIKGDMSLIGPRPTSFSADTYELWQTERLEVMPGLTGLWQIKGRSDIDFMERVELDIEYIERQSWRLDLEILFGTIGAVLFGRGAH